MFTAKAQPNNANSLVSSTINYQDIKLSRELGKGGFGVVYQGTWRQTDVAVKQLLVKSLSEESTQEFESESQMMARLRSPYIVQFYGFCVSPERCIVMEYMPQGSLYQVLHSNQPLDWTIRVRIAIEMASGVSFLHAENIIHRDIKSLNVLLNKHMEAKLTDFGLSKIKHESQSISTSKGSAGTPAWMAPELSFGDDGCTKKSDIYSLGITFWELASRDRPFKKVANVALIPTRANNGYRDEIPADCPSKVATLIQACWDTEPQKRPDAETVVTYLKSGASDFKTFLTGLQSSSSLSSAYQGNLYSQAASVAPAPSGYQNNVYSQSPTSSSTPAVNTVVQMPNIQGLALSSASAPAGPPRPLVFSSAASSSSSVVVAPKQPQVSIQAISAFLKLVAEGEQDQAEELLKKTPDLALYPSDITDLAGRSFKDITGFQYAVWALDWHMWMMVRKYLPSEAASEQIERMKSGSWVQQQGASASWQNLLGALQTCIDLWGQSKWDEGNTALKSQVGGAQHLLPVHVVNEYCRKDRPFEPCPDFTTTPLPRTRETNVGEWYTATYNNGKLGETFAYVRSSYNSVFCRQVDWGGVCGSCARVWHDLKACHTLLETRVQQRDKLFAELSQSNRQALKQ